MTNLVGHVSNADRVMYNKSGRLGNIRCRSRVTGKIGRQARSGAICTVLLDPRDPLLHSERTQGFTADPVYGRAKCLPMLGAFKT